MGDADDFGVIDVGKIEGVRRRTEDLRNVWRDEGVKVVRDCFLHAVNLPWRLREKTIRKVLGEFSATRGLMARGGG